METVIVVLFLCLIISITANCAFMSALVWGSKKESEYMEAVNANNQAYEEEIQNLQEYIQSNAVWGEQALKHNRENSEYNGYSHLQVVKKED